MLGLSVVNLPGGRQLLVCRKCGGEGKRKCECNGRKHHHVCAACEGEGRWQGAGPSERMDQSVREQLSALVERWYDEARSLSNSGFVACANELEQLLEVLR